VVAYPNLAENIKQLPMPENDPMWAAKIVAKGRWRARHMVKTRSSAAGT
jgi:hypothetical protein